MTFTRLPLPDVMRLVRFGGLPGVPLTSLGHEDMRPTLADCARLESADRGLD
jgi:hypothetical protein